MRSPTLLLAAALALPAQDPRPASLEGIVLDSSSSEPLAQVQVSLQPATAARPAPRASGVITGADGRFSFSNIAPGPYRLSLRREGFSLPRAALSSLRFALTPGQSLTNLRFSLNPQAAVSGRVLDEFDEPVSGAIVQLARRLSGRGAAALTPGPSTSTDDLGAFRLPNVDPGAYLLQAVHADAREVLYPTPDGAVTAYAPTYAPSTLDPLQAEVIEARPAAESPPVTVRLRRQPVFPVRGRVLSADGAPLTDAQLFLRTPSGFSIFLQPARTRVLPDGRFELTGVPPGDWILSAFPRQPVNGPRLALSTRITVSGPLDDVTLRAAPALRLTGVATFEGESKPDWRAVNILLRPTGDTFNLSSNAARPNPDGAFELSASGSGLVRLDVVGLPAPNSYLAAVRSGAADLTLRSFPLDQPFAAPLTLVFRSGAASLRGQIESRQPATVLLFPTDPQARDAFPTTRTDASPTGEFTFSNLAPGSYLLYAIDPDDPLLLGPASIPPDLDRRATRVKLEPRSAASVTLPILQEER